MIKLTPQQRQALLSWDGYEPTDPGTDDLCWQQGVRPWPTMDNLERLGLCKYDEWDDHCGRIYTVGNDDTTDEFYEDLVDIVIRERRRR